MSLKSLFVRRPLRARLAHAVRPVLLDSLEGRRLMSAGGHDHDELGLFPEINTNVVLAGTTTGTTSGGVVSASLPLASIPALSSRPGAAAKIYLDFDGEAAMTWGSYSVTVTPAYDTDGIPTTFSTSELANIQEVWARVAEKYSPFNIDVTTVNPGTLANKVAAKMVIGGNGAWLGNAGGVAYVGGFTNSASNIGFVFPKNLGNGHPKFVAEASAHEAGHLFGLNHQSAYSGTTKTAEYHPGTSAVAPVMGNSYSAARGLWNYGPSAASSTTIQDDLAIISNTNNAFGYRVDDHANASASATAMGVSGSSVSGLGVIERSTDSDFFSFTTAGGAASFRADPATYGAMLDLKLELRNAAGAIIASANTSTLGESLTATLGAGNYFVSVSSKGGYGDLGQYSLSGTVTPGSPVTLSAATGLAATAVSPTQVNLAWTDNSTGETGYRLERSADNGATWTTFTLGADANSYSDSAALAGTSYIYRVTPYTATSTGPVSGNAAVTTVTNAPAGLTATAASSTQINLSWSDVSGETGYRIERSPDGVNGWTVIGTPAANVTSYQDTGLTASTTYHYRIVANNAGGRSAASATASAATQAPPPVTLTPNAPTNMTGRFVSSTMLRLEWQDNSSNETGFRIEYSVNGTTWGILSPMPANSTSIQFNVYAYTPYYFRVHAYNANGNSAPTNAVTVQRPAAAAGATLAATAATATATTSKVSVVAAGTFSTIPIKGGGSNFTVSHGKAKNSVFSELKDVLGGQPRGV